ncbi:hypothetical protein NST07_10685 [Paenibacillus sp. FSL L8-0340]|uniref:hypothetical protein n=1 Tax=Paenibacillus sp. FSL L8-0340 TaxID=2954685 RepID=UPI0031595D65
MINYGELYYDHYSNFLGEPIDREVFKNNEERVYNTLGFSKYEEVVGDNVEISLVVDGAFSSAGYILANALFYCIGNQVQIG